MGRKRSRKKQDVPIGQKPFRVEVNFDEAMIFGGLLSDFIDGQKVSPIVALSGMAVLQEVIISSYRIPHNEISQMRQNIKQMCENIWLGVD